MKVTEFYKEHQGRPYASPFANTHGGSGIPPHSIHGIHLAGELSFTNQTDTYTAGDEMVVLVDGNVNITIPTSIGHIYWIKNTGMGVVNIRGESGSTIDGETSIPLTLQYQYVMLICDGEDWWILGGEYVKMEDVLQDIKLLLEQVLAVNRVSNTQLSILTREEIKEE